MRHAEERPLHQADPSPLPCSYGLSAYSIFALNLYRFFVLIEYESSFRAFSRSLREERPIPNDRHPKRVSMIGTLSCNGKLRLWITHLLMKMKRLSIRLRIQVQKFCFYLRTVQNLIRLNTVGRKWRKPVFSIAECDIYSI